MDGTIVKVAVSDGRQIEAGEPIVVPEAIKWKTRHRTQIRPDSQRRAPMGRPVRRAKCCARSWTSYVTLATDIVVQA